LVVATLSVAALALLAPASSSAATTIGQANPNPPEGGNCDPGKVYTENGGEVSFTVPAGGGVITSWATRTNEAAGQQGALKTLRQTSSANGQFTFSVLATSTVQNLTPNALNRFPTRIPVQGGEVIGYHFPTGPDDSQACSFTVAANANTLLGGPSSGEPGSSFTTTDDDFSSQKRLNLEATLEADADRDGFGDETQDGCPGAAGANGGCAGADKTKPTLASLSFSDTTFRAATSGDAFSVRKRKVPTGTKVSFRLSEASSVKFTVQRKARGRKVGGKCKRPTRSNRKNKACTRWKSVRGSFTVAGKAGTNSFTFRGRIGGKALRPGRYRLSGIATDSAKNASAPKRKRFRIVK